MANLPESTTWDNGIYQIEVNDPVVGGVNGISNKQAKALANRTSWLKYTVSTVVSAVSSINTTIDLILETISGLGDSSTKDVGTIAGTVAAGDDSRFLNLTDKGDLTAYDFVRSDLNCDGGFYDLDLSSLIPLSAKIVILRVNLTSSTDGHILIKKYNNGHDINCSQLFCLAGKEAHADFLVFVGSRKIKYQVVNITTTINILVAGYF